MDERIAAGGVGQVWRARDLLLERPVAVKLLRPEYADHPETLERFRQEASHAGALSHPCVAKVYDYGHGGPGGVPYLVMEFVDGPSLSDLLDAGPIEPAFALDVIAQAASGLHAAHRTGLVHRDVKPANILIGPDGRVKITDFGVAHAAGQAPVTAPGLVMGTAQYLAPERISGAAGTPASDLYALGIVLHECLTGMPPYEGTQAEIMAGHLYMPLPPLPAGAPPELDALVARLTAKDPAGRMADANELAALAAILRDRMSADRLVPPARQPVLSGELPPRPEQDPWPFVAGAGSPPGRRRRGVMVLAAASVLLAGACLAWVLASGALHAAPAAGRGSASASAPASSAPPSRTRPAASASTATGNAKTGGKPTATRKHDQGRGGKNGKAKKSGRPSATSTAPPSPAPAPSSATTAPSPAPSPSPSNCLLGVVCL